MISSKLTPQENISKFFEELVLAIYNKACDIAELMDDNITDNESFNEACRLFDKYFTNCDNTMYVATTDIRNFVSL